MHMNYSIKTAAIGIGTGVAFFASAALTLVARVAPFQVGVAFALTFLGITAIRSGLHFARSTVSAPVQSECCPGVRAWWSTPKQYPNGSSFSPRDHAFYGCIAAACLAIVVLLMGWSVQTVSDAVLHAWRVAQRT